MPPKINIRPKLHTQSLGEVIANYIPLTWDPIFEKTQEEREVIAEVLEERGYHELFPHKENIYKAFDLTPFEDVRVVIVGQDPYPQRAKSGHPKAQGLSFSIARDDKAIPGSLRNIYKELEGSIPNFKAPSHGDLTKWAQQGVLLLNMALTVPPGERNAHKGIWKPFVYKTIKAIAESNPDIIFILWGNEAQKIKTLLGSGNTILESGHPSPEAVNRGGNFIGSGHFAEVNTLLETPIDWSLD